MSTHRDRVTIDPAICQGKVTVRGLRCPVGTIVDLFSAGMSHDQVLRDYPDLEHDDILAVIEHTRRAPR
jgi:uncharacterized protein (DUF433 family)